MTRGQSRCRVAARLRTIGAPHRPPDARAVQSRLCRCRRLGYPCQSGRRRPVISPIGSANWAAGLPALPRRSGPPDGATPSSSSISEFGRTFRENGDHGTDHGHGSVYWVLGGGINGGRILGEQVKVEQAKTVPEPRLSRADRLSQPVCRPVPAHVRPATDKPAADIRICPPGRAWNCLGRQRLATRRRVFRPKYPADPLRSMRGGCGRFPAP